MADATERAERNIRQITECSICMNAFTDPRQLPCIHTFCFACLKRTGETAQKRPGDKMACPLCRKDFSIPQEGFVGLQKNFFMESLVESLSEFKTVLQGSQFNLKTGSGAEEEIKRFANVKICTKHTQKLLDYYCKDCKKIVCVSCFVESHKLHDCKDVNTVDEEFRLMIESYARKTSNYTDEMLSLKENAISEKADFLKKLSEQEAAIIKRRQKLKSLIDEHARSLLEELSLIKSCHLKEMETKIEEIDTLCTILCSFEAYCTELSLKGSASDICSSVDELIVRAEEFGKEYEALIGRPHQSVTVSFQATDLEDILRIANGNLLGNVGETTSKFENFAIIVGLNRGPFVAKDILKINLHQPNDISTQAQIPTAMAAEAVSAVYRDTMYVAGIGANTDEIWKCEKSFRWTKCSSLVQKRSKHSAAFIDEVLYICGGFVDSTEFILDSVEAFSAVTNKCTVVGKLVHAIHSSGNCVPYGNSLYIFGGSDKDKKIVSHVQLYNTKENTCTLISKPMPRPYCLMEAALWRTSAILIGRHTCFIFDTETEAWQERNQFKTDVLQFGMVLENGRVFVIGGVYSEMGKDGKKTWKCRYDVRYVPLQNIIDDKPFEWKIHGILPQPSLVQVYAKMRFSV